LDVRADTELVKFYHRGVLVKVHPRQPAGARSTDRADLPGDFDAVVERVECNDDDSRSRWASKAALIADALVYWRPDLVDDDARTPARRRRSCWCGCSRSRSR
jgi:hypothetical protein